MTSNFALASSRSRASLCAMAKAAKWWLYIIRTTSGSLYTGIATDVMRRFREHTSGRHRGSRYLRGNPPAAIVLQQRIGTRMMAARIEYQIKQLDKARKEAVVAAGCVHYNKRSGLMRGPQNRPRDRPLPAIVIPKRLARTSDSRGSSGGFRRLWARRPRCAPSPNSRSRQAPRAPV